MTVHQWQSRLFGFNYGNTITDDDNQSHDLSHSRDHLACHSQLNQNNQSCAAEYISVFLNKKIKDFPNFLLQIEDSLKANLLF